VTAFVITIACIAFVLIAGMFRNRPGRAVGDMFVLLLWLACIGVIDLVVSRFVDTGNTAMFAAAVVASACALDALYGLMAPDRQRQRNRMLRDLMRRRA
jgi:CHASE2 domain-containing sensor protein